MGIAKDACALHNKDTWEAQANMAIAKTQLLQALFIVLTGKFPVL